MITVESLRFLQSDTGADLLAELATTDLAEAATLQLLTRLRKRYSPDNAAAALETARLRIKGREKLGNSVDRMFFTREALEQASHHAISRSVHVGSFDGYDRVADLGCGIGADTIHLAAQHAVVAVDLDPVRLLMAQSNCAALDHDSAAFIRADLSRDLPFANVRAAFFDPARRANGKRIFSVKDYHPSLAVIHQWPFAALTIKLSPGVDLKELDAYGGKVNFVSLNGDLKEALLCTGLRASKQATQATVITYHDAEQIEQIEVLENDQLAAPPLRNPCGYLYEPDPAVIRAGLLSELAIRLGIEMYRLDESIAYLTADTHVVSPLARAWIIDDWMPFNLKKLRAYLREHGIGRVTVKKRGSPITPEELIAQLKLPGGGLEGVIVLTHVAGQPAVLICRTL
ncbi:MAG: class I SAM-dependent methyltransferase [Chloroflexota bacterium]